ncbi:MAG: radical SAM protein [Halioglobus sp.]|nr:radical SAM protein [Halioglobus sp.]
MIRILLVAPVPLRFDLTQDQSFLQLPFAKTKAFMMPLHIATIAGLTPERFHVEIWDEAVRGPANEKPDFATFDIVGCTGFTAHLSRAAEVAAAARKLGILTVVGGPGISSGPQNYYNDFDVLFIGEAELTWPQFLEDFENNNYQKSYRQVAALDLSKTVPPKWDTIKGDVNSYLVGAVQTSRGCPFDCEFCDVSYLFGDRFRFKPQETVLQEVANMEAMGVRRVVFSDDNFYGNPRYTRELLVKLKELNDSFDEPLAFASEATINFAKHDKTLELLADANFAEIFIGIESPNMDSLVETKAIKNVNSDLVADIRKIQSYGISIRGSLIVGFDHDDKSIFDQQFEFVQQAHLAVPSIRVLMAPPGTALWKRVRDEGRLLKGDSHGRYYGNPGTTNILPKQMTRIELHQGYLDMIDVVYSWENFAFRLKSFISTVKRKPNVPKLKYPWARMAQFVYFMLFSLDAKPRAIVWDIVKHTMRCAPFMLPRVTRIIMRQYGYADRPKLKLAIQDQIDRELSGDFVPEISDVNLLISDEFKKKYAELFVTLYAIVHEKILNLNDFEFVLISVFRSLSVDKGGELSDITEGDTDKIIELTHKAVEESNSEYRKKYGNEAKEKGELSLSRRLMGDQILRALEQELSIEKLRVGNGGLVQVEAEPVKILSA